MADITSGLIGLVGVILGGSMSSLSNYFLARAERKRFARERIWDLRREVYTKIIAKMGEIERDAEEDYLNFTDERGGDNYQGSKAQDASLKAIVIREHELREMILHNRIIIGNVVAEWYATMINELGELETNRPAYEPYEFSKAYHEIVGEQFQKVLTLAQRELAVSG
jgi:hypothetical protein